MRTDLLQCLNCRENPPGVEKIIRRVPLPPVSLTDRSVPESVREELARRLWKSLRRSAICKTEAHRWNVLQQIGGDGVLTWCLVGCPSRRLDYYIEHGAIADTKTG